MPVARRWASSMQVDSQTLDAHSAGAIDVPLARRPARIAVLAGLRCDSSSRDTELIALRVGHHHPPLTILVHATYFCRARFCELVDLGQFGLVASACAQVEVEAAL